MTHPNFEEFEKQFFSLVECLPASFGDKLPPRFRLRYFKLLNEVADIPKRVMQFKAKIEGTIYQEPDWLKRAGAFPAKPSANFPELENMFEAMQRSLPDIYVDELPAEHQSQYYKILERHADLQLRFSRLALELQKRELL